MAVAFLDLGGFGVEFLHGGRGFHGFIEGELNYNLGVEAVQEPF